MSKKKQKEDVNEEVNAQEGAIQEGNDSAETTEEGLQNETISDPGDEEEYIQEDSKAEAEVEEAPEDKYNVTVAPDPNFDEKPFEPEWKELTFARVFPSEEDTIEVLTDKEYGGAHNYRFKKCKGFENGETVYTDEKAEIEFVQKNSDGEVIAGLQSEQLVLALIDRHQKLHSRFPSPQNLEMLKGLNMFLNACRQRVHDRMARGVMGQLKK